MKKLLLIIMVFGFANLSQAQTPTKQQSINELNNQEWRAGYFNYWNGTKGGYKAIGSQVQKDTYIRSKTSFAMKDNSCVLEVTINYQETEDKYNRVEDAPIQTKTIEIDMSKVIRIESHLAMIDAMTISATGYAPELAWGRAWVLTFVLVDENFKEIKRIDLIQFTADLSTDTDYYQVGEDLKTTKPYKVLNHLRKLCNAPEPLSWD